MLMSGTGNTLGFLGSSTNGTAAGSVVIHYTDGTSSTATLSLNDWAQGPGSGDTSVAAMTYRNSTDGSQTINMWVYAASVPVESRQNGRIDHVPGHQQHHEQRCHGDAHLRGGVGHHIVARPLT